MPLDNLSAWANRPSGERFSQNASKTRGTPDSQNDFEAIIRYLPDNATNPWDPANWLLASIEILLVLVMSMHLRRKCDQNINYG